MIQIFGTKKSSDSRKAERFFKERGIKCQYVDMKEKGLSICCIIKIPKVADKNGESCISILEKIAG